MRGQSSGCAALAQAGVVNCCTNVESSVDSSMGNAQSHVESFHAAVAKGDCEAIEKLLPRLNPADKASIINGPGSSGRPSLIYCASKGHRSAAKAVGERGVSFAHHACMHACMAGVM